VRNITNIKNEILISFHDKYFHKFSTAVRVLTAPPFINLPKRVWSNASGNQDVLENVWKIEMLKFIGKSLNVPGY
jgi:hypothetical protein